VTAIQEVYDAATGERLRLPLQEVNAIKLKELSL
jgi:hypothetical protein